MSIALSAVVIFSILVPGFAFRTLYRRVERTSLDYAPFGVPVISGIVFAIILHVIWLLIAYLLGWRLDLPNLLHLLGTDGVAQSKSIEQIGRYQTQILVYFSTILFVPTALLAPGLRWLADRRGWNLPESRLYPILGFNAPWYYLLKVKAKQKDADAYVAAVVDFGGDCYLFRGFVSDYYVDEDGKLDRLVLEYVDRRPMRKDKPADGPAQSRYYPVSPSDYFVLRYSEITTLNVWYYQFPRVTIAPDPGALRTPTVVIKPDSLHIGA